MLPDDPASSEAVLEVLLRAIALASRPTLPDRAAEVAAASQRPIAPGAEDVRTRRTYTRDAANT